MGVYANIVNGKVVELLSTEENISEMFHSSMVWVKCSDSVRVGDSYQNGEFHSQTTPQEDKKSTIQRIWELEEQVTPRRIREAILGVDKGWLKKLNSEISELRNLIK